jgi:hypothetical protein
VTPQKLAISGKSEFTNFTLPVKIDSSKEEILVKVVLKKITSEKKRNSLHEKSITLEKLSRSLISSSSANAACS